MQTLSHVRMVRVPFCRRVDMDVATGLRIPFLDGWALPTTWPDCTGPWRCSSPGSFILAAWIPYVTATAKS